MKVALTLPHNRGLLTGRALPIGSAYVAGAFRRAGAEVAFFGDGDWQTIAYQLEPHVTSFDVFGMQTFATNIDQCISLAAWIRTRHPKAVILMGGTQASNFPEYILQHGTVDLIVQGEAESSIGLLVKAMQSGSDLSILPATIALVGNRYVYNPPAPTIHNLDTLPLPAYELFYRSKPIPMGHLVTFRGCPYHCANCPVRFPDGGAVREYSIDRVIQEVLILVEDFGARRLEFYDETFTLNRTRTLQLCAALTRLSIPLEWHCYTRVQHVDREVLEAMKEAGCVEVFFGIGTGVPKLLSILEAPVDLALVRQAVTIAGRIGLRTRTAFSLGLPTETLTESLRTLKFGLSLPATRVVFQPCLPFPGTRLFTTAKEHGRFLIDDWSAVTGWDKMVYLPRGRSLRGLQGLLKLAKGAAKVKAGYGKLMQSPKPPREQH